MPKKEAAQIVLAVVREAVREPSEEMMLQGWLQLPTLRPDTGYLVGVYRAVLSHSPLAEPKP